ncbi:MAG: A/G-specific adenine glycosylase [Eubacterium sp.]|nr:A/G-specific adenine glycosylase [Eubacterium sp.]
MSSSEADVNSRNKEIPDRVCAWFAENKRDLPWRRTKDPYRIWVSEIMLQQTRVEAVRPYYERFIEALPDCRALARCREDRLLKLWEGLGYYSRVRNMQKAARCVTEDHDGVFPSTRDGLLSLPGIGPYTAGAVASIAFQEKTPAVDGNVLRILARLNADDRDVRLPAVRRDAEKQLEEILADCREPGNFNQGLMDLGASVCVPNTKPLCEKCPLADLCRAHEKGCEQSLPFRSKAKERRIEEMTVLLIRDGEKVALAKRPDKGLLAGMYEFPNFPGTGSREDALAFVRKQGLEPLHIAELPPARHLFSHVEWRMSGYEIRVASFPEIKEGAWMLILPVEIEKNRPVPSAFRVYADILKLHLGAETEKERP